MYLKILPMKRVMKFGKNRKFSRRYMDLYYVFHWVGVVAYALRLRSEIASVHLVFHVSMLKKCIGDPLSILPIEGLGVD